MSFVIQMYILIHMWHVFSRTYLKSLILSQTQQYMPIGLHAAVDARQWILSMWLLIIQGLKLTHVSELTLEFNYKLIRICTWWDLMAAHWFLFLNVNHGREVCKPSTITRINVDFESHIPNMENKGARPIERHVCVSFTTYRFDKCYSYINNEEPSFLFKH